MPIYEYLCPACNRVYSFLAKSASEAETPACPKCGATNLRKRFSSFALVGATRKAAGGTGTGPGSEGEAEAGAAAGDDRREDPRVEQEMMQLMDAAEGMDESDPRQLGRLMRRLSEISGEPPDPEMTEAIRRLEAGEDPEKIEAEMGVGADAEAGGGPGEPSHDSGLYPM